MREAASDPALTWTEEGVYISAGGQYPTMLSRRHELSDVKSRAWIVAGLGMRVGDGALTHVSEADWDNRLTDPKPRVHDLDGHYVALRWTADGIDLLNDQLGLRTAFYARADGGTIFSTRLDWLTRSLPSHRYDFEALGAQWLGRGEYGARSSLVGVQRLEQGSFLRLRGDDVDVRSEPFSLTVLPSIDPPEALKAVTNPRVAGFEVASLACSGGLDSRVQLAGLLQSDSRVRLHSYGPAEHPDAIAAAALSRDLDLPLDRFKDERDSGLPEMQDIASRTHAYAPASNAVDWRHYNSLRSTGHLTLDASLGEAGRCFFYRSLRAGAAGNALAGRNLDLVSRRQRQTRPGVFKDDVMSAMQQGHKQALGDVVARLPAGVDTDLLADLLMLRFEGPRYAGYAASYVDALAVGYFPFAQPTMLRSLLTIPAGRRRGGRYYRELIQGLAPRLTRRSLVRNGPFVARYPFHLSGKAAAGWAFVMRLGGQAWRDRRAEALLRRLESPIRDLVRSRATRDFGVYDDQRLHALVDGFFDGRHSDASGLDRWLSFELWRLALEGVTV